MLFSDKIRRLLIVKRRTHGDLAQALGINQSQISRWFATGRPPKHDRLLAVADFFGVTVDYLLDENCEQIPTDPEMTTEDRAILALVHALNLSLAEVARRLTTPEPVEAASTIRLIQKGGG